VVSLAIGIIRSIVALRSGRRRVRSPSAKYRHQTIPIRKRGAISGLNLHLSDSGHVSSRAHELRIMSIHRDSAVEPKGRADCVLGQPTAVHQRQSFPQGRDLTQSGFKNPSAWSVGHSYVRVTYARCCWLDPVSIGCCRSYRQSELLTRVPDAPESLPSPAQLRPASRGRCAAR